MKLIAVLEQFSHHNPPTSPDNMINYIAYDLVIRQPRPVRYGPVGRRARMVLDYGASKVAGMAGYSFPALVSELQVWRESGRSPSLIHFFNGDINGKFLPHAKGGRVVMATYHQPPDFFDQFFRRCGHIRRLDAAIVTSNVLRERMSSFLPEERIFFLPLAVDVDLFRPSEERKTTIGPRICLMVGNWLRDFETMRAVAELFRDRHDVEFRIISLEKNRDCFAGLPNVRFFSGLPLDRYCEEMRNADLMVLPLKSATSNLAVLEGMATGLPLVTTDVGGIRDYVDESFTQLHRRGDARGIADSLEAVLGDESRRQEMSRRARLHAERFSWPVVADRLKGIYRLLGALL